MLEFPQESQKIETKTIKQQFSLVNIALPGPTNDYNTSLQYQDLSDISWLATGAVQGMKTVTVKVPNLQKLVDIKYN